MHHAIFSSNLINCTPFYKKHNKNVVISTKMNIDNKIKIIMNEKDQFY